MVYRLWASVLNSGIYIGTNKQVSLVVLFVLIFPYRSTWLELTKLDLGHTGCDLNKRSRETVFLAVAITDKYAREVKSADISNPQAAIYWVS